MMRRLLALAPLALLMGQTPADPHRPAPVMDSVAPPIPAAVKRGGILIFSKTNSWRHIEHLPHSNAVIADLAQGCAPSFSTENAAVFNPRDLSRFSVIILNSSTGDLFTPAQRQAFADWVKAGGGVVALHAAGDNSSEGWPLYQREMIGAKFIGHPGGEDHIQPAAIRIERPDHPVMAGVTLPWNPRDEWYSFASPARAAGTTVLATLDETSYRPSDKLAMGADHPIVWTRMLGRGRIVYSALGHTPEAYDDANYRRLIGNAIRWSAPATRMRCPA